MSTRERLRKTLPDIGLVALGGAVGTLARYLLDAIIGDIGGVPVGIFVINIVGAFALALLVEGLAPSGRDRWRATRLLLGTGVLGGFTTYSALAVGAVELLGGAESLSVATAGIGAAYAVATLLVGALASFAGIVTASRLRARRAGGCSDEPGAVDG